jgi:hypothetical protein
MSHSSGSAIVLLLALVALVSCCTSATALHHSKAASPSASITSPAASDCSFQDGSVTYDFSSLSSSDLVADDLGNGFTYSLRVCGSVSSQRCSEVSSTASFCAQPVTPSSQPPTGPLGLVLANWDPSAAKWAFIDSTQHEIGVQYTIHGAQQWSVAQCVRVMSVCIKSSF